MKMASRGRNMEEDHEKITNNCLYLRVQFFFSLGVTTHCGFVFTALQRTLASSFEVSRSHTTTRHSRQDSSGRVISSSQRPLPDNTQHSQQTNVHATGGIRTHNLSRRAAVDLRLRPHRYWDRQTAYLTFCIVTLCDCSLSKLGKLPVTPTSRCPGGRGNISSMLNIIQPSHCQNKTGSACRVVLSLMSFGAHVKPKDCCLLQCDAMQCGRYLIFFP